MKVTKKMKATELEFPFGVDISGYVRPNDFEPSVAVLCPHCAEGLGPRRSKYWRRQALRGMAMGPREYDTLLVDCESCGDPWHKWSVPEYFRTDDGRLIWLDDNGQYRDESGEPVLKETTEDGRTIFISFDK